MSRIIRSFQVVLILFTTGLFLPPAHAQAPLLQVAAPTPAAPCGFLAAPAACVIYNIGGGYSPSNQLTFQVTSSGAALTFTPSASVVGPPGGTWLTVPPLPQSTPGAVTITIDATGLPSGTYLGYLTLTAAGAGNSPDLIPIVLTVFPTAAFQVNTQQVPLGTITGPTQPNTSVQVFTSDESIVSFSIVTSYQSGSNWLSVSASNSNTTPSTLSITVDPTGLATNTYEALLMLNPNDGSSGAVVAVTFSYTAPPAPVIASLSPPSATAEGSAFTLTVNGSGFISGATVDWNGSPLTTSYVSGNQLTASVTASLIATPGMANITVVNPDGGTSEPVTFLINAPTPALTKLSPSAATAGGPPFTLTVIGTGFLSGATVDWNGSPLATNYESAEQLTASVTASLIATQGTASITVVNPGAVTSNTLTFTINAPTPVITTLSPSSATAGGPAFTLTVNGSGFVSASMVDWNGSPLATSYVSGNQLTASVTASLIAAQGTASITVVNPGAVTSNTLTFTINAPTPVITTLSPSSATAGGPAFTLTVNGSGFLSGSVVDWNGSPLATSYVSGNQLTASVTASLIAAQGTASITVVNPGAVTSNTLTFTINAPTPVITTLSPSSATAGGPAFTLTVNGSGFVSASMVDWNGSPLATSYVSGNQLTASVTASLIAAQGTASITAVNPGAVTSNTLTFTINATIPVITTLSPSSATAGGPAFTLTVNGSGFLSGSVVDWNGSPLTTSYVNAGQLTASVTASLIAAQGTASITAVNPGAVTSNTLTFTINAAIPVITTLSDPVPLRPAAPRSH